MGDRLLGKVAVVFGAGPNIGGTVAHFLAREGARVMVADQSADAVNGTVAFIRSRGLTAHGTVANAFVEDDVKRVFRETLEAFDDVHVVVNMAGTVHWVHTLDVEMSAWEEAFLSFPKAGILTTHHAATAMLEKGHGGSIIHVLSTAAHFGEAAGTAYCSSKSALLNLARAAAMDLAQHGIRVNTVTPCSMEHQLWGRMKEELNDPDYERPDRMSYYSRDDYLKMIPLQRFPRASDLAHATVFLASDEAEVITGIDLPVDGGLRVKYPTWRPGDHSGVNIDTYMRENHVTEFGEPTSRTIEHYIKK